LGAGLDLQLDGLTASCDGGSSARCVVEEDGVAETWIDAFVTEGQSSARCVVEGAGAAESRIVSFLANAAPRGYERVVVPGIFWRLHDVLLVAVDAGVAAAVAEERFGGELVVEGPGRPLPKVARVWRCLCQWGFFEDLGFCRRCGLSGCELLKLWELVLCSALRGPCG